MPLKIFGSDKHDVVNYSIVYFYFSLLHCCGTSNMSVGGSDYYSKSVIS